VKQNPRAAPPGAGRLDGEQLIGGSLADLGELLRRERIEVLVLLFLRRLVVLAGQVQPGLPFRVAVQPGEILVPPRVRGNRFRRHGAPHVRRDDFYRT